MSHDLSGFIGHGARLCLSVGVNHTFGNCLGMQPNCLTGVQQSDNKAGRLLLVARANHGQKILHSTAEARDCGKTDLVACFRLLA